MGLSRKLVWTSWRWQPSGDTRSFLSLWHCDVWSEGDQLAPRKKVKDSRGSELSPDIWELDHNWNYLLQTTSERSFKAVWVGIFVPCGLKHHSTVWPQPFLLLGFLFQATAPSPSCSQPRLLKTAPSCHCRPYTISIITIIKARSTDLTALRQKSNTSRTNNVWQFGLSPWIQNSCWAKLIYSPKEFYGQLFYRLELSLEMQASSDLSLMNLSFP